MVKVGEHITLDILGTAKEYSPSFYEKIVYKIAKAAKVEVLNISRHRSTNKINPEQIGRKRRKQTNAKNSAGSDDKCPMEYGVKFIAQGSVSEFSKLLGSALAQPSAPDRKD